jgi:CHAT domain-containing protein
LLEAGARSVVGNLWAITEEDARLFAIEFYRAGGAFRGAWALEDAREVLRRRYPDLPRRWAGAVWLGAVDRGTPEIR